MLSLRILKGAVAPPVALLALFLALALPAAAQSATVSGSVFKDLNRDGVRQADEAGIASSGLWLFNSAGTYVASAYTDDAGRYAFSNVADGSYTVKPTTPAWEALRDAWTPTTSSDLRPEVAVMVPGSPTANFGWRPITRSADPSRPISSYVGANGLRIESFNDAVSASQLYATIMQGSLVGAEAAATTIRFDLHPSSSCSLSVSGGQGTYTGYAAQCWITWESWVNNGDLILFHEYGHAWSMYFAYLVQQDATLARYLEFRGIAGDPRLDSDHGWDRRELIAEDYRQLFGSANARSYGQENRDIPSAGSVAGLREFLSQTFRTAPNGGPMPITQPPANTAAPLASGLARENETLTTTTGQWTNSPTSYAYQWQSSADGASWADVAGATGSSYRATSADVNRRLRARVTASNAGGSGAAFSNAIGPISGVVTGAATVSVSDLDASAASAGTGWRATATVALRTGAGALPSGAVVTLRWRASKDRSTATATCTTGSLGTCTVSTLVAKRNESVTWTVEAVSASGLTYSPSSNADPDGDSNGTSITVRKPA